MKNTIEQTRHKIVTKKCRINIHIECVSSSYSFHAKEKEEYSRLLLLLISIPCFHTSNSVVMNLLLSWSSCLRDDLESGTGLDLVASRLGLDHDAALGGVAGASSTVDEEARSAAHVVAAAVVFL